MTMRRFLLLILCAGLPGSFARGASVDYTRDIKPLLKSHCYSCHGALKQEANLRADTAASLRKGGESGPALLAKEPVENHPIIRRITSADPATRMPQESKPLSAAEIALLKAWVEQGAVAPADEQPEVDPSKHWSFQPIVRPAIPTVKRADWVGNPIDAFIAADQ